MHRHILGLGSLGLFAIGLLVSPNAQARCDQPALITTIESPYIYSYVYTPGIDPIPGMSSSMSPTARGSFWALGAGDPALESGIDNGAFPLLDGPYGGWLSAPPGYPAYVFTSWAASDVIDDCVDNSPQDPTCTAVLLTDDDGAGASYFTMMTKAPNLTRDYLFNRPANEPIVLAPLPAPVISAFDGELATVDAPQLPAAGFLLDPLCTTTIPETAVIGYKVYWRVLPDDAAPPVDRRREEGGWLPAFGGTLAGDEPLPLGIPATIDVGCRPRSVYLAIGLVFDSGFESPHVSANGMMFPACDCTDTGTDADGDGYCAEAGTYQDCDDGNPEVFPDAPEICGDAVNNDCLDPDWPMPSPEETDADADGFDICGGDCDDANADVYPDAPPLCDFLNNDCSDPAWPALPPHEQDVDGDGFRPCAGDCAPTTNTIYPGAPEVCDGRNNNCLHPEWPDLAGSEAIDDDGDGFSECDGDCYDFPLFFGREFRGELIYPGAGEICDGIANDCDDPAWPANDLENIGADSDGDGFGLCPDCDDSNALVFPGAPEICDGVNNDCDFPGWPDPAENEADLDGDGVDVCNGDCDDHDGRTYPGAPEVCDGANNDCDDPNWPELPADETDVDGDGSLACFDCDESDAAVFPGAPEVCDGVNNDCNDPEWPALPPTEADVDGDGFSFCDGDCSVANGTVYPGAPQGCDGINNDCNDPNWPEVPTQEQDLDGDGYPRCAGDCDQTNPDVFPHAPQLCDGVNNDCFDPDWPAVPADEVDGDGDGFFACNGECDDSDPTVFPGALQLCDGLNNDCFDANWPMVPDDEVDGDGDGFIACAECDDSDPEVFPGPHPDVCDGIDNDCDGTIDEGTREDCANGVDDDCDGLVDNSDPECAPLYVELESFTATTEDSGVRLRWVTALEIDSVAFRLLHGTSRGRLTVITPQPIPARGSQASGADYEFLDRARRPAGGFYYLEEIDLRGDVTRFGPADVVVSR